MRKSVQVFIKEPFYCRYIQSYTIEDDPMSPYDEQALDIVTENIEGVLFIDEVVSIVYPKDPSHSSSSSEPLGE